jgi:hypothetical protein
MAADHGQFDLDDILEDVRCIQASEARSAEFLARTGGGLRGAEDPGGGDFTAGTGVGRGLLSQCPPGTRLRYETLLHAEATFPAGGDHGYLIGPACQILEAELDRLLAAPARGVADDVVAALRATGDNDKQADILDKWARGEFITTLGTSSVLLLGLRRAREQGRAAVGDFFKDHFRPRYLELLEGKGLGACLDWIRNEFRNPVSHGKATFTAAAYERFVGLAVASLRFTTWDVRGPDPESPGGSVGALHHLLSESRRLTPPPPTPDALARLLALRTPATSPLRVQVRAEPAGSAGGMRDVDVVPGDAGRPFRLGDAIRFVFEVGGRCHLALIDVGTRGTAAVVWPNAWQRDTVVESGRAYSLPRTEAPEFVLRLTGLPGVERVVAVVTAAPLAAPLLPAAGAGFRKLAPAELVSLADEVAGRDPATWAVATCEFAIEP